MNEFLNENSPRSESGQLISHTTNSNIEQSFSGGLFKESAEDNSLPPSRKQKGRPSGSKNKPKPPMSIMENSNADMENIVLEIPIGNDVVKAIIEFARRHEASIIVMKGSGLVSDITLLQPNSHVPTSQLDGPFKVFSLNGTYLNLDCGCAPSHLINDSLRTSFCLQLSGSRGQVFGGVIGGKINAASNIQISAFLFKRPQSIRVVTTDDNVQLFEDDDVPTITSNVDAGETQSELNDQILP